MSGWRYRGDPAPLASIGVGGVAGLFGGIGQVSGPPVIAFWMSGPDSIITIRANMFCFFGILGLSSFAAYFWYGLYSAEGAWLLVVFVPPLCRRPVPRRPGVHADEGRQLPATDVCADRLRGAVEHAGV